MRRRLGQLGGEGVTGAGEELDAGTRILRPPSGHRPLPGGEADGSSASESIRSGACAG